MSTVIVKIQRVQYIPTEQHHDNKNNSQNTSSTGTLKQDKEADKTDLLHHTGILALKNVIC